MPKMDPAQSIMDSFRRIVRTLRTASRSSENDLGLRAAQLFVLQQLKEFEPQSLNELAARTCSHQNTVSVVVHGLVKKGLVRRRPSKKDRRFLVLDTTAAGKKICEEERKSAGTRLKNGPPTS